MPAGRFSEAERAPYYARALASIAQTQNDNALTRAALEHYADHAEACARERSFNAAQVAAWIARSRRARELAKEH
jgi:acetyl-CoA acetyltransferase